MSSGGPEELSSFRTAQQVAVDEDNLTLDSGG